jgi:membrane-bound lytic murein transglycosylase A
MTPQWRKWLPWIFIVAGIAGLLCCAPLPTAVVQPPALESLSPRHYPHFDDRGGFETLEQSISQSLRYLHRLPAQRTIAFGPDRYTAAHLVKSLEDFRRLIRSSPSAPELNRAIRNRYRVYRAAGANPAGEVLFTGYYEPLLQGSPEGSAQYPVPIHGRPTDLVEIDLSLFAPDLAGRRIQGRYINGGVLPYPTRGEIRRTDNFNALAPPVAWLKDEVDLLTLQIQGSGKVRFEDGQVQRIQFDSSNGRPYRSIGRRLIDQGRIAARDISMPAIRAYLQQHPDQVADILDHNPRYIFFKEGVGGPIGSLGVPLTPMRSLAVDHGLFPSAALAFFNAPFPHVNDQGVIEQWAPLSRFVLAQDAGSAIKGPGRADLFVGAGSKSEVAAGHLKHPGRLYFLVLKP